MKGKITKLAAAAVIIVVIVIGIQQFGDGANVAWGDVEAAYMEQTWVYVKFDNDTELWHDHKEKRVFYREERPGGMFQFVDCMAGRAYMYRSGSGTIEESAITTNEGGYVQQWHAHTAWYRIMGPLERAATSGRSDIERYFDTVDGKKLVRFDHYIMDALDKKILHYQLWADPSTHLPVRIRSRLSVHERRRQNRQYVTGEFHFPSTGPATIYDLGVPADVQVINRRKLEDSTSSEPNEILQASRKAAEDFPSQYLAIIWESGTQQVQVGEVDVIYRNDEKIHVSVYVNMPALKNSDLPTASDEVLRWTRNQQPLSVTIFDGEKEYRQSNTLSLDSASLPEVYVHRTKWPMLKLQLWFRLKHRFWPHVDWAKGRHSEIVANHPETPAGCICLLEGDTYFFVDPDKDYLCIGTILPKTMDAHSHEYIETTWWSDLSQLPTGHWYPRKEHLASFPDPERGISGHERDWNINIQLLREEEFPPHVFDGEKLLEGAKVETY